MSTEEIRAGDWVEYSPDAPYRMEGRWYVTAIRDVGDGVRYAVFWDTTANVRHLRRSPAQVTESSESATEDKGGKMARDDDCSDVNLPVRSGWYWARFRKSDDPDESRPVQVRWRYLQPCDLPDQQLDYGDEMSVRDPGVEWGPKIPTPQVLLTHKEEAIEHEVASLIDDADFDGARAALRVLEAKIEQRTGTKDSHPQVVYLSTCIDVMEAGIEEPEVTDSSQDDTPR